jgi:hypothetical protein
LSSCAGTQLFSVFDLPILSALHNRKYVWRRKWMCSGGTGHFWNTYECN